MFYLYLCAGVIFLVAILLAVYFFYTANGQRVKDAVTTLAGHDVAADAACVHRRALDGTCVEVAWQTHEPLVAVMIENHTAARPQSGLVDAAVVYEAPVEANFTRFLALYPLADTVGQVGPVRSARPYYLDWLAEHGSPLYMHVGGSPAALSLIAQRDLNDLNEFSYGWYFWRSADRHAPHNTYTASKLWQKAWDKYYVEQTVPTTTPWLYEETGSMCTADCVEKLTLVFAYPSYIVHWNFNTSTGQYERSQPEGPHQDSDGRQIVADTILVQQVKNRIIDEIGRQEIETIGSGAGMVLRDGFVIPAEWRKLSLGERTRWYDAKTGAEIALRPGKIWIEVVPREGEVVF